MDREINEIIAKVLSGEASNTDHKKLDHWIKESHVNQNTFDILKKDWSSHQSKKYLIVNAQEIKDKIWNESKLKQKSGKMVNWDYWVKIAASLLILISVSWFIFTSSYSTKETDINQKNVMVSKSNPYGQKSKIFLPDGSEVWLNVGSTITYQEDFDDSARIIELSGEAFFDVTEDSERPFTVKTGSVYTTALGTSFNINAYDKGIAVALVDGKVMVKGQDKSVNAVAVTLNPGQIAYYRPKVENFEVENYEKLSVLSWKDGILYFKDATFSEVISRLERWYGIEVQTTGNRRITKHYTGKFDNESLQNVMENIAFAFKLDYEINNKKLKIYMGEE